MVAFFRKRSSPLARLRIRLQEFSRKGSHSLAFLNSAQFLGVINDNVFKLVMVYLLIDAEGPEKASNILSAVGFTFVLPFILFSSTAGVLADRFSKQKLLMIMKVVEMTIMGLAIVAFAYKSSWGCFALLFLLATHSALFGPSKYGIIPELVPEQAVSKANGLITSFTYLAIILGTFLASFITDITDRNFILAAIFCFFVAAGGFISSLGIKHTHSQHSSKKFNPFFIREIYQTLVFAKDIKHLLTAIFGSAFFLFIGAFAQLNIIPFAIQALHLSEVKGGYLFLVVAVGIAIGAFLAGKASRKRIELGLSCLAGVGIGIFLLLLSGFSHKLPYVICFLMFIGGFGGAFIVPFDTFIQVFSPHEKRGQVIGASNFVSFCGVLIASFALYLFSEFLHLTASQGFAVMGVITLIATFFFTAKLSDLALPYFSRKMLKPFFPTKTVDHPLVEKTSRPVLILQNPSWFRALLLLNVQPNIHFFIPCHKKRSFPWFKNFFYSLHAVHEHSFEDLIAEAKKLTPEDSVPCIFMKKHLNKEELPKKVHILFVEVQLLKPKGGATVAFSS